MKKKLTKAELLELLLERENKEIKKMDEMVDLLVSKNLTLNVNGEKDDKLTFGERMSDKLAKFAGSWIFIGIFLLIIALWLLSNIYLFTKPFDAYPFILLNLFLSCIAALQAPIIMMSQNRQEKKDRIRNDNDYKIDLKSEFILEDLYNKVNKVLDQQETIKAKLSVLEKQTRDQK